MEEKELPFRLNNLQPGIKNIIIEAKSNNIKVTDIIMIQVTDKPNINIANIDYPKITSYYANFNMSLSLKSETEVKEVKIKINKQEVLTIPSMKDTRHFIILTSGKDLYGNDEIRIDIEYKDSQDNTYKETYNYPIEITNAPWYMKIMKFLGIL